jgi:hypothetical protein
MSARGLFYRRYTQMNADICIIAFLVVDEVQKNTPQP